MSFFRRHAYSSASLALAITEVAIAFAATSHLLKGTPLPQGSPLLGRLVLVKLAVGFLAFLMSGLAVAKEKPLRLGVAVVVLSLLAFFLSGFRVAV